MGYILLTGGTGLLGAYLVRDLLRAGFHLALVTRPSRLATPRQRVEEVMTRWEKQAGHSLPRPVIFEGDLARPALGLDRPARDWIKKHCDLFLHNGASVNFARDRHGDPWRTNVDGVEHVLEFCREARIREYHHVSTAYVCGLRRGLIRESDVDLGQEFSNEYERSKVAGEKLVRSAGFKKPPTVYRPSIIIGDARTGHTTTFHGFYAPLRLGHAMFKRITRDQVDIDPLQEALQLTGQERKHLVPVDWVSAVITHVLAHAEHHGRTYHLVPEQPVTVEVMRDAMVQAFLLYGNTTAQAEGAALDWREFTQYFIEKMKIYEAYWRDDPQFDRTNTERAAPHLPCPVVNFEMLLQACRFALNANFGWPRTVPPLPALDVGEQLESFFERGQTRAGALAVNLQANGPGGGQWHLEWCDGRLASFEAGLLDEPQGSVYLNTHTWMRLLHGATTVREAVLAGHLIVEDKGGTAAALEKAVQELFARPAGSPAAAASGEREGAGWASP